MKVEVLNGGWMTTSAALWRPDDDPGLFVRYPIPAFLVETDTERILIDAGLHPAAAADTAGHYNPGIAERFSLELDQPIAEQIDAADITRIVLTHLHFDHAGGLSLFPASIPIVVQRTEWEAGKDPAAIERNFYNPRDYEDEEREVVLVDGDHDLLGDGSIELLSTPGHTPGHQSVRIGERLVIGGDAIHYASTLDDMTFPAFADDYREQRRSAERLRDLRDDGLRILPGHDPDELRPGPLA